MPKRRRKSNRGRTATPAKKAMKSNRGRRYSAEEKKKILDTARRENLTGDKVAKRFGVSTLTFYRWRRPVRGRRRPQAKATSHRRTPIADGSIQAEARAQLRQLLPRIVREEIAIYLAGSESRHVGKGRAGSRDQTPRFLKGIVI